MTPTDRLKAIISQQYYDEDGNENEVELRPLLNPEEMERFMASMPGKKLPADIAELLANASGFSFPILDEISFTGLGLFGLEDIFPCSIQLCGDGFGNFWILDVLPNGNWGKVFYACHDPSVIVYHSADLDEFLKHIHESGINFNSSFLNKVHEEIVFDIWKDKAGLINSDIARQSGDKTLAEFAASLPNHHILVDLRKATIGAGFALTTDMLNGNIVRHETELIWAFERKEKKSFWAKLLGK